jgi:hypothetical protein
MGKTVRRVRRPHLLHPAGRDGMVTATMRDGFGD